MTLRECIELHEAAERARPAGHPIRVIRAFSMTTDGWMANAAMTSAGREERSAFIDLAALAQCLDAQVGIVTTREAPCPS